MPNQSKKKISVIVLGAGSRGRGYANIMKSMPDCFDIVGVAEPVEDRRNWFQEAFHVAEKNCVDTWEKLLERPKFADLAVIATMDRMHFAPAMMALEKGYDLLLEKPIAPTREECRKITRKAAQTGRKVMVCHVLRYTQFFMRLKEIIHSGMLGDVVSIEHIEAVGNVHQSHSFIRGNWGNEQRSSFMLLQKCCHDLDILQWLLAKDCKKIQSFGSLMHFKKENAPKGAVERCTDSCPHSDTCPYNAVKLYFDAKDNLWFRSTATSFVQPTDEQVMEALKTTQYGKCVYFCDNDVVDHQVVNMEFDGGTTVSMTMCAFTQGGRRTHIMGTKGELIARMDAPADRTFEFYNFENRQTEYLDSQIAVKGDSIVSGHGGGDEGIIRALYRYLSGDLTKEDVSEIDVSYQNHLLAFAAERSRLTGMVVDLDSF